MRHSPWWIPVFALLPLLLYIAVGYGGHDFQYHAASWLELHHAWRAHEWRLGWSQGAHFGFGEPRFCFYPPLSFLVGGVLSFLMPFRLVPGAVVWLVLTLSGLSMYKLAESMLPKEHRLLAAVLYMFNSYLFMTVLVRFAIAEAWCQALLPLAFLYFYRVVAEGRRSLVPLAAGLLALEWLSNIPEAIGIFYAFNLLAVVLAIRRRSAPALLWAAVIQVLALVLAAFRLAPAFAEQGWVKSQTLLADNFRLYMQFTHIPGRRPIVYICGVQLLITLALVVPAAIASRRHERAWRTPMLASLSLMAFALCFQLPFTTLLWEKLPEFKFVLFPYRLLPLVCLSTLLVLFAAGTGRRLRQVGILVFAVYPFLSLLMYHRLAPVYRFRSISAATSSWQRGFEGMQEYVPVTVPVSMAEPAQEQRMARRGPFADSSCAAELLAAEPNTRLVRTNSPTPCTLVLNTYYYPFWKATLVDGSALAVHPSATGLLQVLVPASRQQVRFSFVPATRVRTAADLVSLITFLTLAGVWGSLLWAGKARPPIGTEHVTAA